jgi:hypothetical protein
LPEAISGHYGNALKRYIIYENFVNNVSQLKIWEFLRDIGIQISEGEIHNILMEAAEQLSPEYEAIGIAGKQTARELRVDDTGGRHKSQNGFCLVMQNDLFAYFKSSNSKSRIQFLKVLRGSHTDYVLNDTALNYIISYKPTEILMGKLAQLKDINFTDHKRWESALIDNGIAPQYVGKQLLQHIEEAGILGSAIEHGLDPQVILLSDGAQQYHLFLHAACWVHAERGIKKIVPCDQVEAQEIEEIRKQIWDFYEQLKKYKENPSLEEKLAIEQQFDKIFAQTVSGPQLAVALRKFVQNKEELLRVLDYPFIQLHNNSSEQAIRAMVIKNNISGPTRSEQGRCARDIFVSLVKTCKKLSVSFWAYLTDRINKTCKIDSLAEIIRQKAYQGYCSPP